MAATGSPFQARREREREPRRSPRTEPQRRSHGFGALAEQQQQQQQQLQLSPACATTSHHGPRSPLLRAATWPSGLPAVPPRFTMATRDLEACHPRAAAGGGWVGMDGWMDGGGGGAGGGAGRRGRDCSSSRRHEAGTAYKRRPAKVAGHHSLSSCSLAPNSTSCSLVSLNARPSRHGSRQCRRPARLQQ